MWNKTFAGLLCGLFFLVLAPSALSLIFQSSIALLLGLTILFGLSGWAGTMVWCYAADSGKEAWKRGAIIAIPSICLYAFAFFVFGVPK